MFRLVYFVSVALLAFAGTSSAQADIDTYVSMHNAARTQYAAGPLTWNTTLASVAQAWADRCGSGGSFGPYGENLALGIYTYNFTNAMEGWMGRAADYDPSNPVGSPFTQVVWKNTTQVGCAYKKCIDMIAGFPALHYFVCEYYPPGNIAGEFPENVKA